MDVHIRHIIFIFLKEVASLIIEDVLEWINTNSSHCDFEQVSHRADSHR